LRKAYGAAPVRILVSGAARNKHAAQQLCEEIQSALPGAHILNLAGAGTLTDAAAQLAICDEIWAVDSGMLHIARLLGLACRSFWGPTMPAQRLRPMEGLQEQVFYRPFLCSPCIQTDAAPPCGGYNICMISMDQESPDLRPSWIRK